MLEQINDMFIDYESRMKGLKKPTYEKNMEKFRAEYGPMINEMLICMASDPNQEQVAADIGKQLADKVFSLYEKRGKISNARKTDLSFYMIVYVFPAILLTQDNKAKLLCDKIRDTWNEKFNTQIDYTDYDTIYSGFRDKLFGIF